MDSRNYEDVGAEKPLFGEATRKVNSLCSHPLQQQLTWKWTLHYTPDL